MSMTDIVNPILQWLNTHPQLAGLGVFVISAAESVAVVGTIIPGSIMMTTIGALAGAGVIPLWSTIIWAILGAIVGDGISYWIGYSFKERLHNVWPFRNQPYLLEKGESFFHKYGSMSVFIGRFVGPVRAIVPLVAGMFGMKPARFYFANVLSAIGWAPAYMLPGIILGAASLELPPDIAVHAILVLLLTVLFIILCIWSTYKLFAFIGYQINSSLNRLWNFLSHSNYFHIVADALKHHDSRETHGQLTLAGYVIITFLAFLALAGYVYVEGSQNIGTNNTFFYLFRSFRSPLGDSLMIPITFLGELRVVLPVIIVLFIYFSWKKSWHTSLHILAATILVIGLSEFFKHMIHSTRPWGVAAGPTSFSFPSGHSVVSLTFYVGILLLWGRFTQLRFPRVYSYIVGLLILLIAISRLYLGLHWFTDVIGGWLLGTSILLLIVLSYNRNAEKVKNAKEFFAVFLLALLASYSIYMLTHLPSAHKNYAQVSWPVHSISLDSWWNHKGDYLPVNRVNRFGLSDQLLNLQWVGNLPNITQLLLKNGWEWPQERNWIGVLQRVIDVKSAEHLPLVSPLYLDQEPVLVLIKHYNGGRKLIVLRLWNSNLNLLNSRYPLWVGDVELTPRTYGWLFKRKRFSFILTPEILFNAPPKGYEVKQLQEKVSHHRRRYQLPIILIKQK